METAKLQKALAEVVAKIKEGTPEEFRAQISNHTPGDLGLAFRELNQFGETLANK